MIKKRLSLQRIDSRLRGLQKEFRDLRNTTFAWGQRDTREIDQVIERVKKLEDALDKLNATESN